MKKAIIRLSYRLKMWFLFDVLKRYSPKGWPPKKWVSYRFTYGVCSPLKRSDIKVHRNGSIT